MLLVPTLLYSSLYGMQSWPERVSHARVLVNSILVSPHHHLLSSMYVFCWPSVSSQLTSVQGFQYPWLPIIRANPSSPPVIVWMTGFSGALIGKFGPEKFGGTGDILCSFNDP